MPSASKFTKSKVDELRDGKENAQKKVNEADAKLREMKTQLEIQRTEYRNRLAKYKEANVKGGDKEWLNMEFDFLNQFRETVDRNAEVVRGWEQSRTDWSNAISRFDAAITQELYSQAAREVREAAAIARQQQSRSSNYRSNSSSNMSGSQRYNQFMQQWGPSIQQAYRNGRVQRYAPSQGPKWQNHSAP